MMKLIVDLLSIKNLNKYNIDGLVIHTANFSTFSNVGFTDDEIKVIVEYCNKHNILAILSIDKIIHEYELDKLEQTLDYYLSLKVDYFIYSDFAVLTYFIKKNITNKLIFDSKTLITNYEEAKIHLMNYKSLVNISNELTLEEINQIAEVGNTVFEIYGHHQIFYSKRTILTNYQKFKSIDTVLKNRKLYMKEELREGRYPIFENKNGFFVYTDYRYFLFKEVEELKNKLLMGKINAYFMAEDELFTIIDIYNRLLKNDKDNNINELEAALFAVYNNLDKGHLYKASVLLGRENSND